MKVVSRLPIEAMRNGSCCTFEEPSFVEVRCALIKQNLAVNLDLSADRYGDARLAGVAGAEAVLHHLQHIAVARVDTGVALALQPALHFGVGEVVGHGDRRRHRQPRVTRGSGTFGDPLRDAVGAVRLHRLAAAHSEEAIDYLVERANTNNRLPDLILLDINMPALTGIELLRVLHNRPAVIIISAYKEYAIEGFELDVVDYLVKPVSAERLFAALNKVRRRITSAKLPAEPYIVLKVDREKRKFLLNNISLFEAYGNYVKVWQGEQMTLVNSTLKWLLQQLPDQQFVQVHKSFVVNKDKVLAVEHELLRLEGEQQVKVGKLYKHRLIGLL